MLTKADIKLIKSLSDKSARTESGLFVVEGAKMVEEAIGSGLKVEGVFATEKYGSGSPDDIPVEYISEKEMERISHLKTPSNSIALVAIPGHSLDISEISGELTIALDDIQDPGNMGTIIRIADWFGIGNIICSAATADCYNPKVVQASMGALFRVKVHYTELSGVLNDVNSALAPIYGTFLDGEDIYGAPLSPNGIILMGNEGRGISPATAEAVTHRLFIPSYPPGRQGPESLNVAVATAITCSEFRRRKF